MSVGPIHRSIKDKISSALKPASLQIIDESSKHKGHAAMQGLNQAETHFRYPFRHCKLLKWMLMIYLRLEIVSDAFTGKKLIDRHRMVHQILDQELKQGVHALSLSLRSIEEK